MCNRFLLCSVTFLLSGIIFVLCFAGVEANAEVFTVEKKSAADIVGLIGNTISCSYEYNGSTYSTNFTYQGIANANSSWRGLLIDDNDVFNSVPQIKDYDFIIYSAPSSVAYGSFGKVRNVTLDLNLYFESYARGGFAMTSPVDMNSITDASNSISSYPDNYAGNFSAICGNVQASASLASYYGVVSGSLLNGNAWNWRSILYKIESGGGFSGVHFDNVISGYDGTLYFGIWCPYVGGSMETAPPVTTTTTSGNSGGATIINNNVDLTETHSILGGISNFLSDIWEAIRGIPGSILSGIQSIFVPSDEFMEEFEDEIEDIRDRFSWAEDIKEIGAHLVDITKNRESVTAPVVVIPSIVNSKNGRVYSESGEKVLDLADYETEVLTVRVILTALLWVFFLWRLYARLPDIIHGGGMIIGDGSRILNELDERQSQELYNDFDKHDIDKLR